MLLFALPVQAEEWSTTNKWLMGATCFAFALDGISTHEMLKDPNVTEANKILGEHPSDGFLALYLVGCSLLVWAIADFMPDRYRPFFLTPFLLVELRSARGNFEIAF